MRVCFKQTKMLFEGTKKFNLSKEKIYKKLNS